MGDGTGVDGTGLRALPGAIDPHVHLRAQGQSYKEGLGSGTFGMARETGEELNRAVVEGDGDGLGLGAAPDLLQLEARRPVEALGRLVEIQQLDDAHVVGRPADALVIRIHAGEDLEQRGRVISHRDAEIQGYPQVAYEPQWRRHFQPARFLCTRSSAYAAPDSERSIACQHATRDHRSCPW